MTGPALRRLALTGLLLAACGAGASTRAQAQEQAQAPAPSPWYLQRGTAPRPAAPEDGIPGVAQDLARLLKDGGVPGFYDGQFQSVAGRFDELAELASDPDVHHVLRVMAVMALQEAGDGERVAAVLQPLLIRVQDELDTDRDQWRFIRSGDDDNPIVVRDRLAADLSLHARFALAKDGQPAAVLEKITALQQSIRRKLPLYLDPTASSDRSDDVRYGRQVMFNIGYHYQQFDDFEHASEWFHMLTDNLPGTVDTRWAHYNLACIAAITGHPDEAMDHLRQANAVGFTDSAWMAEDGDLKSLRDRPDFKLLLGAMRNEAPSPAGSEPPSRPGSTAPAEGSDPFPLPPLPPRQPAEKP